MKKLLLILTSVLFLSACALPGVGSPAASPKPTVGIRDGGPQAPKCAELDAQAAASPNVVVSGAWNCLTPQMQQAFNTQVNVSGEQSMAAYAAAPPAFTHYYSCGETNQDGWWYFDLRNNVSPTPADPKMHYEMRMQVDSSGKVSNLQYAPGYVDANTC